MRIGRLRHRIQVQTGVIVKDPDYGQTGKPVYTDFKKLWCEPISVSGGEAEVAMAQYGKQLKKFRIRYRTDLTTKMRIIYKGQAFDITDIAEEDHKNMYMVISAMRGLTSGQ